MSKAVKYLRRINQYLTFQMLLIFCLIIIFHMPDILVYDFKHFEFPKGPFRNTLIAQNGCIIIGNSTYSRIQVYDQNGNFLLGWFAEAFGGGYSMAMDDKGIIHLLIGRINAHFEYDQYGDLISQTQLDKESRTKLYSAITSRTVNDRLITVARCKIKTPIYWYPFMFIPTFFFYFLASSFIELFIKLKLRKIKRIEKNEK